MSSKCGKASVVVTACVCWSPPWSFATIHVFRAKTTDWESCESHTHTHTLRAGNGRCRSLLDDFMGYSATDTNFRFDRFGLRRTKFIRTIGGRTQFMKQTKMRWWQTSRRKWLFQVSPDKFCPHTVVCFKTENILEQATRQRKKPNQSTARLIYSLINWEYKQRASD